MLNVTVNYFMWMYNTVIVLHLLQLTCQCLAQPQDQVEHRILLTHLLQRTRPLHLIHIRTHPFPLRTQVTSQLHTPIHRAATKLSHRIQATQYPCRQLYR